MLKFLSILLAAAVLAAPAHARRKKAPVLEDNKAYVLYLQGCPICQNALEYINERYLTRPDVVRVDLETEEGRSLLKQCAKKFGFKSVVAPVVCIGDKHFMDTFTGRSKCCAECDGRWRDDLLRYLLQRGAARHNTDQH